MSNLSTTLPVRVISSEFIKPAAESKTRRIELTPWDLTMLSVHYIQKGLLFPRPVAAEGDSGIEAVVARLKGSLSLSLVHFFPLAGRLASTASEDGKGTFTYLDCSDQGAEFTRAVADEVTVADVLAPGKDIPQYLMWRLFPGDLTLNHDGHTGPLLSVQLTELVDGIFLGCSLNHAAVDGTSFWHFLNVWAEISREHLQVEAVEEAGRGIGRLIEKVKISRPPVHDRWFFDGRSSPVPLPFSHPDEFIKRFGYSLELRERLFHFSPMDMAALKARANSYTYLDRGDGAAVGGGVDAGSNTTNNVTISSFQALCALVWRAITRARRLPENQPTRFFMSIDSRRRLQPALSPDYFGNSVNRVATTTTSGELLSHDLGWAAVLLNRTIAAQTDRAIRDALETWTMAPVILQPSKQENQLVFMTSSPRFDMYDGCDFGWGRPIAVRCGGANKFDGKITAYPGEEGGGSVDLELTLVPETMAALESNNELTSVLSSTQVGVL